jgi:hypothetical protein
MKHVKLNLAAFAAILASASAFTMKSDQKTGINYVYLEKAGGVYKYYSFPRNVPHFEACLANNVSGACTFTSTKTAGFFNGSSSYQSAPPPISTVTPVVNYPIGTQTAYQLINP